MCQSQGDAHRKNDAFWANEMIRIIEKAGNIVARGDQVFFDLANPVEFGAARMIIIDLDVAAENLSDDFKTAHNAIEWKALARTRDKYAHHYENIDREVVWNLLSLRLPTMATILQHGLEDGHGLARTHAWEPRPSLTGDTTTTEVGPRVVRHSSTSNTIGHPRV